MTAWIGLTLLGGTSALMAAWLTRWFRDHALRKQMIDAVGARSSHSVPTPRGGGGAIVIAIWSGMIVAGLCFPVQAPTLIGLIGGGAIVAAIGWIDDHGHVAARYRLAAHAIGAIWLVAWLGPLPLTLLPFWQPDWWLPADIVTVLVTIWFINLYNFMDGIDGLAASEAVGIGGGGALLSVVIGGSVADTAPLVVCAAAAAGFLVWNWPPARIFMGDAGSGFLGFCVPGLALACGRISPLLAVAVLVLAGVFVADASVTLCRRLWQGDPVHMAHRSHAYQRLARRAGRHLPVTMGAAALTWLWLLPMGYGIAAGYVAPMAGVAIALAPLFIAVTIAGAGRHDEPRTGA